MTLRARRLIACVLVPLAGMACGRPAERAADTEPSAPRADIALGAELAWGRATEVVHARVPRNATLASLLRAHQVSEELANEIVTAAREVFDPRRLRAEQPYQLRLTVDGLVREFVYKIDADRFLRVVGLGDETAPRFDVQVVPYEKQRALVSLRGRIDREHPSLVSAVTAAGENVLLAMALADVFGGDIDFTNDLQPGDGFDLVFEKTVSEGEFAGYGRIVAAEFRNEDRVLRAYRFEVPGGEAGYYDERGRSLKRFFLRSPLKFEPRISSGFSYRRLHPVLGVTRAHPAIDYRAPVGAPVVSVAAGTVVRAGYSGGAGHMVTVRHPNGYESSYLHLSRYGASIRAGARVSQGQVIGYVGATGVATGPHLDYRLRKNGAWVNPLAEHRKLPPGDPIPAAHLAGFAEARDRAAALFLCTSAAAQRANAI